MDLPTSAAPLARFAVRFAAKSGHDEDKEPHGVALGESWGIRVLLGSSDLALRLRKV